MLRIGIAGANARRGWAINAHLPAIRSLPQIKISAVSARTMGIAEEAKTAFGADRAYDDSLALALDPDIDVVAVTVKVPEHRAIVLAAIGSGKHVYCEWPLGRNVAEAEEMAAVARAAASHVVIGLQGAYSIAVQTAARLVADKTIGEPLSLRVISPTAGWGAESPEQYVYLQDDRNGATLATIAGGHTLAAIEAVVGCYEDVGALASTLRPEMMVSGSRAIVRRNCADHLLVSGRHESGCVSSLEVIGGVTNVPFAFELRGTKGDLTITGGHAGGYQAGVLSVNCTSASVDLPPSNDFLEGPPANVANLWADFANDIRSGRRSVPDFKRAAALTHLIQRIDASSMEDRRLSVRNKANA